MLNYNYFFICVTLLDHVCFKVGGPKLNWLALFYIKLNEKSEIGKYSLSIWQVFMKGKETGIEKLSIVLHTGTHKYSVIYTYVCIYVCVHTHTCI